MSQTTRITCPFVLWAAALAKLQALYAAPFRLADVGGIDGAQANALLALLSANFYSGVANRQLSAAGLGLLALTRTQCWQNQQSFLRCASHPSSLDFYLDQVRTLILVSDDRVTRWHTTASVLQTFSSAQLVDHFLRMITMHRTIVLVLLTHLSAVASGVAEDAKYLMDVVNLHSANRDSIRTWQGHAEVRVSLQEGTEETVRRERSVDFVYDRLSDSVRWNFTQRDLLDPESWLNHSTSTMRKGSEVFRLLGQGKNQKVGVFGRSEINKQAAAIDFDPTYFLTDKGQPLDDRFQFLLEQSKASFSLWKFDRSGSIITALNDVPVGGVGHINRYRVDLAKGGNLVEWCNHMDDGSFHELIAYEYEEVDGTWVPSRVVIERNNQSRRVDQEIRFTKNVLNAPVAEDAFTLAAMGVVDKTRITDSRTDVTGVVSTKVPGVELLDGRSETTSAVDSSWLKRMIVGVNVAVLALIALRLFWRKSS